MFKGSIVAIVTPFKKGKVDEKSLGDLIEWHVAQGTNAIVPCGTTGESATLDYKEHFRVISFTVKAVKGRVPVIAGTGANSTSFCHSNQRQRSRLRHGKKVLSILLKS